MQTARAGEQGRGFAVVADAVRKLAERTANATREIDEMVMRIQIDPHNAVSGMCESAAQVDARVALVHEAHSALLEIRAGTFGQGGAHAQGGCAIPGVSPRTACAGALAGMLRHAGR